MALEWENLTLEAPKQSLWIAAGTGMTGVRTVLERLWFLPGHSLTAAPILSGSANGIYCFLFLFSLENGKMDKDSGTA